MRCPPPQAEAKNVTQYPPVWLLESFPARPRYSQTVGADLPDVPPGAQPDPGIMLSI